MPDRTVYRTDELAIVAHPPKMAGYRDMWIMRTCTPEAHLTSRELRALRDFLNTLHLD